MEEKLEARAVGGSFRRKNGEGGFHGNRLYSWSDAKADAQSP
jgi:hypothetical protein